jgi:Glycosyl hydrolase family 26
VTKPTLEPSAQWITDEKRGRARRRFRPVVYAVVVILAAVLIRAAFVVIGSLSPPPHSSPIHPTRSISYLGVYEPDAPNSYSAIDQFAQAIGRQPNIVPYYSHWGVPFDISFATEAAQHGAEALVQIAPRNVSLSSIANGHYDSYLRSYALAVKAFGGQVILSFGHEMNGYWYSWSLGHTSAPVFVNAWRHIVNLFRDFGVRNVTWLWTVNVVGPRTPSPARWWPGRSYVNWVGIDGYYRNSSSGFSSVFGPTIVDVRELTSDPILIAETAAQPSANQSARIAELFAGVHTYGLLGFVWFDEDDMSVSSPGEIEYWRLSSPAALAAFRRDVKAWMKPLPNSALGQLRPSSGTSSQ